MDLPGCNSILSYGASVLMVYLKITNLLHASINNISMENILSSKTQRRLEEWWWFTFLQVSLTSALMEGSWIPISVSAFNVLQAASGKLHGTVLKE
jgi:hypothetical protein